MWFFILHISCLPQQMLCTREYNPVCGNNTDYPNACRAQSAGFYGECEKFLYAGECSTQNGLDVSSGEDLKVSNTHPPSISPVIVTSYPPSNPIDNTSNNFLAFYGFGVLCFISLITTCGVFFVKLHTMKKISRTPINP